MIQPCPGINSRLKKRINQNPSNRNKLTKDRNHQYVDLTTDTINTLRLTREILHKGTGNHKLLWTISRNSSLPVTKNNEKSVFSKKNWEAKSNQPKNQCTILYFTKQKIQ